MTMLIMLMFSKLPLRIVSPLHRCWVLEHHQHRWCTTCHPWARGTWGRGRISWLAGTAPRLLDTWNPPEQQMGCSQHTPWEGLASYRCGSCGRKQDLAGSKPGKLFIKTVQRNHQYLRWNTISTLCIGGKAPLSTGEYPKLILTTWHCCSWLVLIGY